VRDSQAGNIDDDDDDDDSAAAAADDDDVDVTQTLAAHASAWQASSTSMLSDADRSRLSSTVAPVTGHAIASVIASAHLSSPGGPSNAAASSSSLSPPNAGAALSASDESHAKMLRQRAIAFSLIDKLVAQSDPIITHGMKGVLMSAGVAAHLLSYVSRHDWAAEDAAPDIEELRAARSLTVVRLFSDASPTFREFVQQRLREVLSTLLLLVEVPGARGDFAHFKSILGELLTISAVETVSVFVRNDLLRLLERADEPGVAYTITTMLAAGAVPSEQYRRAFYASVTDVGLFRYLAKSIAMPTQSALRCAHLALLSSLLEEFLWTPQSEMLFVGLFKGASGDTATGALKLGPAAAAAAAAAATTMATDDAAGDNAPGVVQQLANVLSIATQRLGAANEPVAAPSPRSSSAAHALPDDFDDPELLRQRVTLVVGLLGQFADARLASPPPPMAGGAGAGGGGLFGRQAFGLGALGLAGHAERRHGLTRFEAQLKNSLRPCVTHVCAILAQLAVRDATRSGPLKLSAFTVQRPLGLYRLALIQALISMLRLEPTSMLPRVTPPAWATLTDMFFEYRFNSIYQRLYCDIVGLVIHNNCQQSLATLLEQTRLVGRIVERYEINAESEHREDAQRGSLLRVANLLRLRAAAAVAANDPVRLSLANEPRWATFVERAARGVARRHAARLRDAAPPRRPALAVWRHAGQRARQRARRRVWRARTRRWHAGRALVLHRRRHRPRLQVRLRSRLHRARRRAAAAAVEEAPQTGQAAERQRERRWRRGG
jgi:hypothetical protein